jgi:hypothetical protein
VSRVDPAKPPVNRKVENPPAFPRTGSWPPDLKQTHTEDLGVALATSTEPQAGMTLRDYFAAHAMTGFMANSDVPRHSAEGLPAGQRRRGVLRHRRRDAGEAR